MTFTKKRNLFLSIFIYFLQSVTKTIMWLLKTKSIFYPFLFIFFTIPYKDNQFGTFRDRHTNDPTDFMTMITVAIAMMRQS